MIHPNTELRYISEEKGFGVVATRLIPKGTITWVQDELDQVLSKQRVVELGEMYNAVIDTFCFRNNCGDYVLCWDHGRFVNHSFNSNCLTTAYNFEIAVRDILPGEELTDDYGYLNLDAPFRPATEIGTREMVFPDDLLHHHAEWDSKIHEAILSSLDTEQKLWDFISDAYKTELIDIVSGKTLPMSILACYYDREKEEVS